MTFPPAAFVGSPKNVSGEDCTAKLSYDIGPFNSTKYDSVNVTGLS